ncbi:MAG TPA: hypothetical protein VJ028_02380 [Patescibacteria group bacterium]|nr:hypothetical protein [Patescibacteria group bacterium]
MNWIILIIVLVVGWFVLSAVLQQVGIKRVAKKATEVSNKLRKLIQNKPDFADIELYSRWLEKINPEQLWIRSMAHSTGNKKLRGELGAKLWQACEAMDRVTKLDYNSKTLIHSGAMKFSDIEEAANGRKNLIALVDQCIGDIQKKIS